MDQLIFAVAVTGADVAMLMAIVVLLVVSTYLAVAETGLTRISRAKAQALVEEGRRGSERLAELVARPERFLNPVLLVVLVCQLVQATLTGILADRLFGALGVVVATVFNVVIVFVLAEAAPKTWAIQHPERAAFSSARPVAALVRFWPLRMVSKGLIGLTNVILPGKGLKEGPFVTTEELLALADAAVEGEVIEEGERELIEQIIDFGDTIVREVMVPRPDMVAVPSNLRVVDVMEVVLLNGYSRLPAYAESVDDVVGIVYAKDLMRADRDGEDDREVGTLVRTAHFVPETKRIAELLAEMQAEQYHMAVVVDEYGGTAGLVTLEDLIEELVGEIVDEFDREEPMMEPVPGGGVRVNARMAVDEVNDLVHAQLPEGDWDSIGGLMLHLLGHIPVNGESVECDGFVLRAERVQGRRIGRVRIQRSDEVSDRVRSGFVSLVGRPNVGKSTLLNRMLGTKVSIVSDKPQTTRTQVRGVLTRPDAQVVFVDTPGIHKPRTQLGERLNAAATDAIADVDVVCLVVDATAPIGPGDRFIAARVPTDAVVVVNKVDLASADQVLVQLARAAEQLDLSEYFPVSAVTGQGVDALVEHLVARLPEGPRYYPDDMVTDVPEAFWVAELVREQLLAVTRDELPHAIATRVVEWEWPRIRVEILVERDSQKGIVIGKRGQVLKEVGTAVRRQLPEGAYLELFVKVEKDWQRRHRALDRLGL